MESNSDRLDLDRFLTRFQACLRDFDHFIERNTVDILMKGSSDVLVSGRFWCIEKVYLNVTIQLQRIDRTQARMLGYSFHAGIAGEPNRAIFRYDNAHPYLREKQPDAHHKHRFDPVTGREIEPPEWIGAGRAPAFCTVLAELEQWWLETGRFL